MSTILSKTIGRNVLSGYAIFFTRTATAFFLTPFVIWSIGVADYGLWLLVLSATGYFSLFDFGFGQAIVRYVAMKKATGERQALNELVSTFVVVYAGIGLLIVAATILMAYLFPLVFHIAPEHEALSRFAVLVIGFTAGLNFPLNVFGGLLHGYQRYDLTRTVDFVGALVSALLTLVVLLSGFGLPGLVVISAAIGISSGLALFVLGLRVDSELDIRLRHFRLSRVREVTTYSIYFFFNSAAVQICHRSDQIIIGLLLPTTAIAIYGVNLRLVELSRTLASQLNQVLFPVLAGFHAISDKARLREVLIEGTRISLAIIVGIGVHLVILAPPFIELWVGREFLAGYSALVVLVIVAVMMISQDIAAKTLLVTDGQRIVAAISLCDTVTNVVLSILLVQRWGIVGAALGTAIPFAGVAIFQLIVACRRLKLPIRRFVLKTFVPAGLSALPTALLLWGLSRWAQPSGWLDLIWQSSLGLALNTLGFALFCLSADQRSACLSLLQRRRGVPGVAKG